MLRRPLLFIAVGIVAAILIEYYMGTASAVWAGVILLSAVFYVNKQNMPDKRKAIVWLVLVSYILGGMSFFIKTDLLINQQNDLMSLSDNTGVSAIGGRVTEVCSKKSASGDRYLQMTVKTAHGNVLVNYYQEDIRVMPGYEVDIRGSAAIPSVRRNPGRFDYNLYLKSRNISVTMIANNVMISGDNPSVSGKLYIVKESFIRHLRKATDRDTAAVMRAIMFGDKGELDEDMLEVFQRNGTAHILAVSGLHIGIIYGFILKLWTFIGNLTKGLICGRKGMAFFVFNSVFFGCYMMMANFSPSVVRAVIMVLIHVFAQLTNRKYDLSNAAILVMSFVLINNPYMLFNVGFQMSFLAVLTLVLVMPFIKNIYTGVFLSSLVVQIGLGPFIIYNFNYFSLIAVLINVPVIFLAGLIVPMGLVSIFLGNLPLFDLSAKAVQLLCEILQWINNAAEISGITTFQVPSPPIWIMAFYYLALLTLATEEGRLAIIRAAKVGSPAKKKLKDRLKYVAKICVILLMVSSAFAYVSSDHFEDCNLTFVDVGQGDCMCVRSDGTYLIDGGGNLNYNLGRKTLRSYLLKNGMGHVDGAFVTHLHTDHYKGICELCQEGMVKKLFVYEGNRLKENQIIEETGLDSKDIEYIHSGQHIQLGREGLFNRHQEYVEVLWPDRKSDFEYAGMLKDEENENAMSLIFRVHFLSDSPFVNEKETTLLVTGDLGEEGEAELISEAGADLKSNILKAGHHGSKYSSSDKFLDAVSPDIAVIQVGKNNYGHPTPQVLERLAERDVSVYRNDTQGAIGFEIKKGRIYKVVSMITK